jgi:hypothetical protein
VPAHPWDKCADVYVAVGNCGIDIEIPRCRVTHRFELHERGGSDPSGLCRRRRRMIAMREG